MGLWLRWLKRRPVTAEIVGSSPISPECFHGRDGLGTLGSGTAMRRLVGQAKAGRRQRKARIYISLFDSYEFAAKARLGGGQASHGGVMQGMDFEIMDRGKVGQGAAFYGPAWLGLATQGEDLFFESLLTIVTARRRRAMLGSAARRMAGPVSARQCMAWPGGPRQGSF